jgi:hypothetical protein
MATALGPLPDTSLDYGGRPSMQAMEVARSIFRCVRVNAGRKSDSTAD